MGVTQLLSVPYAIHSKTAESLTTSITESDPIYSASESANITSGDLVNLSNLSGINTGDQDLSGYLTVEIDPVFLAHPANLISNGDISNWNSITWSEITSIPVGFADGVDDNTFMLLVLVLCFQVEHFPSIQQQFSIG